jgi:anti-anti-sigma regulatory factor
MADLQSIVKFSGVIDVRSIQKPYQTLKKACASGRGVVIDLAGVVDIDVTFLQLVESARRSAAQAGLRIRLAKPAQGAVLETLTRAGFLSAPADDRTRFWLADTGVSP